MFGLLVKATQSGSVLFNSEPVGWKFEDWGSLGFLNLFCYGQSSFSSILVSPQSLWRFHCLGQVGYCRCDQAREGSLQDIEKDLDLGCFKLLF